MTVGEMIDILEQFDPNLTLQVDAYALIESHRCDVDGVRQVTADLAIVDLE